MSSVYSVALYRPVNDDDISRYENNIKRVNDSFKEEEKSASILASTNEDKNAKIELAKDEYETIIGIGENKGITSEGLYWWETGLYTEVDEDNKSIEVMLLVANKDAGTRTAYTSYGITNDHIFTTDSGLCGEQSETCEAYYNTYLYDCTDLFLSLDAIIEKFPNLEEHCPEVYTIIKEFYTTYPNGAADIFEMSELPEDDEDLPAEGIDDGHVLFECKDEDDMGSEDSSNNIEYGSFDICEDEDSNDKE